MELLTIAEYSGLDNAQQHLGLFKLAQTVGSPVPHCAFPPLVCHEALFMARLLHVRRALLQAMCKISVAVCKLGFETLHAAAWEHRSISLTVVRIFALENPLPAINASLPHERHTPTACLCALVDADSAIARLREISQ